MLNATLRRLERHGIVDRRVLSTRPVAVEYSITALGTTLRRPVDEVLLWVDRHRDWVEDARRADDDAEDAAAPPR